MKCPQSYIFKNWKGYPKFPRSEVFDRMPRLRSVVQRAKPCQGYGRVPSLIMSPNPSEIFVNSKLCNNYQKYCYILSKKFLQVRPFITCVASKEPKQKMYISKIITNHKNGAQNCLSKVPNKSGHRTSSPNKNRSRPLQGHQGRGQIFRVAHAHGIGPGPRQVEGRGHALLQPEQHQHFERSRIFVSLQGIFRRCLHHFF